MLKTTPDNMSNLNSAESAMVEKTIPFLGGRPIRECPIGADDVMNLLIACNTCSSFEEFYNLT
jgi:hypothetical protein